MRLVPVWSGLFQAAFKHQAVVQGVADAFYLRRPDIQLPTPPIATIDVPYELVPNLRDVFGISAAGDLHVMGKEAGVAEMEGRRVVTVAGLDFGEDDEDALIDHELGTFFHGNMALAPDGRVLAVSNAPSFALFSPDGERLLGHADLRAGTDAGTDAGTGTGGFQAPAEGAPFWETGAGDVAAGEAGFLVGGRPLHRLDHYGWDGSLRCSIRRFTLEGEAFDLEAEGITNVAMDPAGRLYAAGPRRAFVFAADGTPLAALEAPEDAGPAGDFHLWLGVAADGTLWNQFYKGKEVAYAAFRADELGA